MIIESTALFYREGSSDKEYNVFLEDAKNGYVVNFTYGRRGNAVNHGSKTNVPVTLECAQHVYQKLISEKQAKGYVANGEGQPFSAPTNRESTGLIPQLLNEISVDELDFYIQSPYWIMEEKLDGKRVLVQIQNGNVIASNRLGLVCGLPTEIVDELSGLPNMILDGELIGNTYHAFDVLEYCGANMRPRQAIERLQLTEKIVNEQACNYIRLVQWANTSLSKTQLYANLLNKEGVVLKELSAPYTPGRPNSGGNALKCKNWSSATVQVIAHNPKRSVLVGARDGDTITSVGNVTVPPNYKMPNFGDLIEVKYLYYFNGGSLYQPQYKGARDDKHIADSIDSLKAKNND